MHAPIRLAAFAAFALLALSAAPRLARAEGLLLRLSSSKQPLVYRTTTTLKQQQTVNGIKFDTELTTTIIAVWTFQHADQDGNLHWQCQNKRLQVRGQVGFLGEFKFDSTTQDREQGSQLDAALVAVYAALSGATFEVTLNPRGRVVGVTGFDGFITPLVKDDLFALQYTFGGTDKGAALVYQEQFVVFGDGPAKPGATWSIPYDWELPSLGKVTGTKSFVLRGRADESGRSVAEVGLNYDMSVEADVKASGVHTTGLITTRDFKGTAKVDTGSGQVISLDSSVTLAGTVSVEIGGVTYAVPTEQLWNVAVEKLDQLPGAD